MPKPNDEPKRSAGSKLDRRAMMRTALVVGGVSALAGAAAAAPRESEAVVAEREWARALARHIANQLPEAVRQLPDLRFTQQHLKHLPKPLHHTFATTMHP